MVQTVGLIDCAFEGNLTAFGGRIVCLDCCAIARYRAKFWLYFMRAMIFLIFDSFVSEALDSQAQGFKVLAILGVVLRRLLEIRKLQTCSTEVGRRATLRRLFIAEPSDLSP